MTLRSTTLCLALALLAATACDPPGSTTGTPDVARDTTDTTTADLPIDTTGAEVETFGPDTGPDTTAPDTSSPETTGEVGTPDFKYFAVIVSDQQIFPIHRVAGTDPCATASSPLNAHGADIDAIGLFDGADLIGYLDTVDYQEGGLCPNKPNSMTDPDAAKGAPNATIGENFVSLGGGWLIGEFAGAPELIAGDTIVVYESGSSCGANTNCGGLDEGYEVFVAGDLDCVNEESYPYGGCAFKVADDAAGEASIPVSGF